MAFSSIFFRYLTWHYARGFREIFAVWFNFFWFGAHYFSLSLLMRTLFSPWRRMNDEYQREGVEALMETFVMNTMSSFLGMVVRIILLLIGVCFEILLVFGLIAFLVLWILIPIVAIGSVIAGVVILFS